MFEIQQAERLKKLPPYLFKEIDRMKDEVRAKGVDIIDLGVGDPDRPTPGNIVNRLIEAAQDPANHQYPSYTGMNDFRRSVAAWYGRRFGVELDPLRQVVTLIGSKEGIANISMAFIDPGDLVLVPEPAYPVYHIGAMFAGGESYFMPLLEKNGFLPDLEAIPDEIADRAKMMFINYPNNPTGATVELDFYRRVVDFAARHRIIVLSDAAYSEMSFDGYESPSLLQAPGALEVGLEFHSLSKTYNMTGWRIAWAAGRAEIVEGLGRIKSNIDSGAFQAVQWAGIEALEGDEGDRNSVLEMKALYTRRRDLLAAGLNEAGLAVNPPRATFYLWGRTPPGYTSAEFAARLLSEAGIVCTPGNGFGPSGEGFVRFTLCQEEGRLQEAVGRIKAIKF